MAGQVDDQHRFPLVGQFEIVCAPMSFYTGVCRKISSPGDVFPVVDMLICPRFVLIAIKEINYNYSGRCAGGLGWALLLYCGPCFRAAQIPFGQEKRVGPARGINHLST
jgi:hypothetical protein